MYDMCANSQAMFWAKSLLAQQTASNVINNWDDLSPMDEDWASVKQQKVVVDIFSLNISAVLSRLCSFIRRTTSLSLSLCNSITPLFSAESLWTAPTRFHLTSPALICWPYLFLDVSDFSRLPRRLNAECLRPRAPGFGLKRLSLLTRRIFQSWVWIQYFHQVPRRLESCRVE